MAVIVAMGAWEWTQFANLSHPGSRLGYVVLILALLYGCYQISDLSWSIWLIIAGLIIWLLATVVIIATQRGNYQLPATPFLPMLTGILVLNVAWLSLVLIHGNNEGNGPIHMVFLLVLIWTADACAFFSGRRWGKTRLAARISPGKTWEGVYGALVGSTLVVIIFNFIFKLEFIELFGFIIVCLFTVMVSIMGDLLVSLMKRRVGLKDSGQLIPGHGGILDRIDSLSSAAPVFLVMTSIMGVPG
jgi:phosphatidate cytidylyltransferase